MFIALMLFFILCSSFRGILEPLFNSISRYYEAQADAYAASLGFSNDLKDALFHLFRANLSDFHPDWLFSRYFYTHPTLIERRKILSAHHKQQ